MTPISAPQRVVVAHARRHDAEVFRRLLAKDGYDVVLVTTSDAAVRALEEAPCVALLVGCGAPGLDAVELASKVRASKSLNPRLCILGLADNVKKAEMDRATRAGINEVLVLPFAPGDVVATLRSHLAA